MELADLGTAGTLSAPRGVAKETSRWASGLVILGSFFALGAGLLAVGHVGGLDDAVSPKMGGDDDDDDTPVGQDDVLIHWALTREIGRDDPVILDRLARNMAFVDGVALPAPEGRAELITAARRLGMERADPIVRRRLIALATQRLVPRSPDPGDPTLKAYLDAHRARYDGPATVTLDHRYFRQRGDAEAALHTLNAVAVPDAVPDAVVTKRNEGQAPWSQTPRLGDGLAVSIPSTTTPGALARLLGDPVAAASRALPPGRWSSPLKSPYGWHLLRITRRRGGAERGFAALRPQLLSDWRHDTRPQRLRAAVQRLRAHAAGQR